MTRALTRFLQKPIVTEKSVDVKERQRTLCFRVHPDATKTEIKEAVQAAFKVKVASVHTSSLPRQDAAARQDVRLPARLEEGVREVEGRRESSGVR